MKAIVGFYTKARAVESLASFYVSCAQVEIEEYQNYEKGLAAFKEAARCLSKSKSVSETEMKMRVLKHKIDLVSKFCEARSIVKKDPSSSAWEEICEKLLNDGNIDVSSSKPNNNIGNRKSWRYFRTNDRAESSGRIL